MNKICSKCGIEKDVVEFGKSKTCKNGLRSTCKKCDRKTKVKYKLNNPNKVKEQHKRSNIKWYLKNPEYAQQQNKQYFSNPINRIKVNKHQRERYKNDPVYRTYMLCKAAIRDVLKGISKSCHTVELLGCSSIEKFRENISKKFQINMTWDNRGYGIGKWHLHHIIFASSFDLTDPEQQKKCCHYSNLQPMWHEDHMKLHGLHKGII